MRFSVGWESPAKSGRGRPKEQTDVPERDGVLGVCAKIKRARGRRLFNTIRAGLAGVENAMNVWRVVREGQYKVDRP